jgi:hypothetical protein
MSEYVRGKPWYRYQIVRRHGNGQATVEYADDLESALQHQSDFGGDVEEYTDSDRWQVIKKGDEVSE